ncbi:MAG: hypothetical protein AAFN65_08335 [Bacteroidota bacterium]
MNKMPFYLLVLMVIFSCQKDEDLPAVVFNDVDPELRPYYEKFLSEAADRGFSYEEESVYLGFDNLNDSSSSWSVGLAGICNHIGGDSALIDRAYWDEIDEVKREMLVYHELGHCLLSREHSSDLILDQSLNASLMRANTLFSGFMDIYSPYWYKYYLDELFRVENLMLNGQPIIEYEDYERDNFFYFRELGLPSSNYENSVSIDPGDDPYEITFEYRFDDAQAGIMELTLNEFEVEYLFAYDILDLELKMGEVFLGRRSYRNGGSVLADDRIEITFRIIDGVVYLYADEYLLYFVPRNFSTLLNISMRTTGNANRHRIIVRRLEDVS